MLGGKSLVIWVSRKREKKFSKWYSHTYVPISLSCLPLLPSWIQPLKLANTKYSCNFQCALVLPLSLSAGTQLLVMRVKLRQLSQFKSCQQDVPPSSWFPLLPLTVLWLCISFLDPLQNWFCSLAKQKMLHCWRSLLQLMWGRGMGTENWNSEREGANAFHFQQQRAVRSVQSWAMEVLLQTMYLQIKRKQTDVLNVMLH